MFFTHIVGSTTHPHKVDEIVLPIHKLSFVQIQVQVEVPFHLANAWL